MVVAPGTHIISVKYTIFDIANNKIISITKKYGTRTLEPNKIYDIAVNLGLTAFNGGHSGTDGSDKIEEIRVYSGHNYYMWDARKNYWFGHEWDSSDPWQPEPYCGTYAHEPQATDTDRWYHVGIGGFEASVNPLFKQLPNANEMAWYVMKGDVHLDTNTQWQIFGKIYTGGIWVKKINVIAQEQHKTREELKAKNHEGLDMRTTFKTYYVNSYVVNSPKPGKPADSEIDKYFFLPAQGAYFHDPTQLYCIGNYGGYWSSTSVPRNDTMQAYGIGFYVNRRQVFVTEGDRSNGATTQLLE